MIKQILTHAGRYNDTVNILENIIIENVNEYPVYMCVSNGKVTNFVSGVFVREEAAKLLLSINNDIKISGYQPFPNLERYVITRTNDLLHNYAVALTHGAEPTTDIDIIRTWEILQNLIICYHDDDWNIPEGWKYKK